MTVPDVPLAVRYQRVRAGLALRDKAPLDYWRFAVPRFRKAFGLFTVDNPINELHARGPNKGTKTQSVAAFVTACAQKRERLDEVLLPRWRGPVECAQLVLDYPQQLLSVQAAYLKVLGDWPHHPRKDGEVLKSLRIQPVGGSDRESTWSVIHFLSQKNLTSGKGVRADIVAFDEPPVMSILQELRKAAHAGRRGIRLIGETPTKRREWAPLREDYGDTPRRSIRRVDRLRAEVRWSLDEVTDWCLSAQEKRDLWDSYRGDPLFGEDGGARWHGDYTNTEGSCPFDVVTLMKILHECTDPEIVEWRVSREASEEGKTATVVKVPVQVWRTPETVSAGYQCIDPASGVDDTRHNPAGMLEVENGTGDLLVRWNGYLAPYSLGVLGSGIARQYHNSPIDIEMKDHWGVNVVRGCTASNYGNLCHERRELSPGVWAKEVGFDNNEETRNTIIGCIQEWIAAYAAGTPYAKCPSRAIIESLLDAELDERGKIVAGPGSAHGEDMILWGQALRRAVARSSRPMPEIYRKPKRPEDDLVAMIQGKAEASAGATGTSWLRRAVERPPL